MKFIFSVQVKTGHANLRLRIKRAWWFPAITVWTLSVPVDIFNKLKANLSRAGGAFEKLFATSEGLGRVFAAEILGDPGCPTHPLASAARADLLPPPAPATASHDAPPQH